MKIARFIAASVAITFFLALGAHAQTQTSSVIAIRAGHLASGIQHLHPDVLRTDLIGHLERTLAALEPCAGAGPGG